MTSIKETARQAALNTAAEIVGGADMVEADDVRRVADAVAMAVLREADDIAARAFDDCPADVDVQTFVCAKLREMLAEFTPAPVTPDACATCGGPSGDRVRTNGKVWWHEHCAAPVTPEPPCTRCHGRKTQRSAFQMGVDTHCEHCCGTGQEPPASEARPTPPPADAKEWTCPTCEGDALFCGCLLGSPSPPPEVEQAVYAAVYALAERCCQLGHTGKDEWWQTTPEWSRVVSTVSSALAAQAQEIETLKAHKEWLNKRGIFLEESLEAAEARLRETP